MTKHCRKEAALFLSLLLSGCASYHNTKGNAQIAMDQSEDGVQSLSVAARKSPRSPDYQIDYLTQRDKYTREFLSEADALRADGKLSEARSAYERALRLDANNARALDGLLALQQDARHEKILVEGERHLEQGKLDAAQERVNLVLESNPKNKRALKLKADVLDARTEKQIAQDKARAARTILDALVTLQFRDATLRVAFESLSKSTGLNILLDKDVKPEAKVTLFVRDVTVLDAIDLILLQNQLDKRVINGNTLLVYPANAGKQAEYEDLSIRSFRVTNTDIKYLSTMLKTMLKLREVAADEKSGMLVVRDTPERLRLTERLIAAHDVPDPEIMLEVQVLEVSETRNSNIGIKPPGSFTVTTPGTTAAPLTLGQLRDLRSGDPLRSIDPYGLQAQGMAVLCGPAWVLCACAITATTWGVYSSQVQQSSSLSMAMHDPDNRRQRQYEAAKSRCSTPDPKPPEANCSDLSKQIDRLKESIDRYKFFDAKYAPGRHTKDIEQMESRIEKLKKQYNKDCTSCK